MTADDLADLRRMLTPAGWILGLIGVVAFLIAAWLILHGMGFRFDPFDRAEGRADRAEASAAAATSNASARTIEAAGAHDTTTRVETAQSRIRAGDAIAATHTAAAEAAPDAQTTLDPDRLARLRDVDRQLCELRPTLCAAKPAASRDAGDGDGVLHPPRPGP